jgi:molybdate transport system substrate-binding protein
MRFRLCAAISAFAVLAGCGAVHEKAHLQVFAAASLKDLLTDVAAKLPDLEIEYNFAGSNQLASQIADGARADVFASADFESIKRAGLASTAKPFARNKLVIISSNAGQITKYEEIARPGVKLVIAAKEVPAGRHTLKFLNKTTPSFKKAVLSNVVSEEQNVRAVLAKVALGEADAGVVYATDAQSEPRVKLISIPEKINEIADYYIAVVHPGTPADTFVKFLFGDIAREALAKRGFFLNIR